MPPIGRRTVLKLVAGSLAGGAAWAALPWAQSAALKGGKRAAATVQDRALTIAFDTRLHTALASGGKALTPFQASESLLLADGAVEDFALDQSARTRGLRRSAPRAGPPAHRHRPILAWHREAGRGEFLRPPARHGRVADPLPQRRQPAALEVAGWRNAAHELADAPGGFWSFSGATHTDRRDWVQPLKAGFDQRNTLSMDSSDYGGGTPVANLWRRDVGLAVGHVEPVARLLDLPVRKTARGAQHRGRIHAGLGAGAGPDPGRPNAPCWRCTRGDHFAPLQQYRQFMQAEGIEGPKAPESAFAPIWCAWGYERDFTVEQILATLPKARELGFEWAVLDDGWQTNEGDWRIDKRKFPRGDADMRDVREEDPRAGHASATVAGAAGRRSGQRRAARPRGHAAAGPGRRLADRDLVERVHPVPGLPADHRLLRGAGEEDHRRLGLRRAQARRPASECRGALLQPGAQARASRPSRSRGWPTSGRRSTTRRTKRTRKRWSSCARAARRSPSTTCRRPTSTRRPIPCLRGRCAARARSIKALMGDRSSYRGRPRRAVATAATISPPASASAR